MNSTAFPSIAQAINGLQSRYNWIVAMRGHISTVQINAAQFNDPEALDRGIFIGSEWDDRMRRTYKIATECLAEIDAEIIVIREAIEKLGGTLNA